jgi:DNA polymerase-3 subunit alpha
MYLIFDTETTGLPRNYNAPLTDFDNWPRLVQLAWQQHDATGKLLKQGNIIVKPNGFSIPYTSEKIHGISTQRALNEGSDLGDVLNEFAEVVATSEYIAGHNIEFDLNIIGCEYLRLNLENVLSTKKQLDTKELSTDYCAIPGGKGGKFKWPSLTELHTKLFQVAFEEAHDAAFDVDATAKCFFELLKRDIIPNPEKTPGSLIVYEPPVLSRSNFKKHEDVKIESNLQSAARGEVEGFVHLHVHSQYSVLQSTSTIDSILNRVSEMNGTTAAVTDSNNMMGAFHFVSAAHKKGIKPIVGCELNVCKNHKDRTHQDDGFPVLFLAKNYQGYQNLSKLSSIANTDGYYYVPRIDKDLVAQYKEGLIVSTGSVFGEVPFHILNIGEERAEEQFLWWKETFGEDFYGELTNHGLEEEHVVNEVILQFCKKHNVAYFASNNSYYTNQQDAEAQDALLCVKDGEFVSKPSKYVGKRGREFRFGFPNNQFYMKSAEEMTQAFPQHPEALNETLRIAEKCESFKLDRDILLPKFEIDPTFIAEQHEEIHRAHDRLISNRKLKWDEKGLSQEDQKNEIEKLLPIAEQSAYLRHLTYLGAEFRYGEVTPEIQERLEFELSVIENSGYPGYLLIVQDFCNEARKMNVSVGPGRGSAAGSAVAYCLRITDVDPIKYDLLFERFLNPDRVSMPDMDIDFEDEGREKVINYVRQKYSPSAVAQIITYGTMAAKSAVRDAGRVFELPLSETDRLAKLIPDKASLKDVFKKDEKKLKEDFNSEDIENMNRLKEIAKGANLEAKVLQMAQVLEGSVRSTGTHACGVIITPDEITKFVPVARVKDSDMWCTQFDNSVVEKAGLLKMDFLGLKTLTIIKNALQLVKHSNGIDIDIDHVPIDDEKTYELFQRGDTVAIFQYESEGMRKHMRDLKPTVFGDLIAMNALYRPGPMDYIPSFVKRKHGLEKIEYDLPEMEGSLKETYGITVYQEQVMLLSQKLANFSKGQADVLRKAMGKKLIEELNKMKSLFMEGAEKNGHPREKLEKIWADWERFASYAFNKSHSTCYAWIAYQTAYLKAHYPAEFMAATLSNSLNDLKTVTFFMEECKRIKIPVLSPDVNESLSLFSVNKEGAIRFGLAAVKGIGENAVESIVKARTENPFEDIYDFMSRIDERTASKRIIENLALCGALDRFGITRAAYFLPDQKNETFVDNLLKYARAQRNTVSTNQGNLFDTADELFKIEITKPQPPDCEPWDALTQLTKEKEMVGMFISGHPLDDFNLEIKAFCQNDLVADIFENITKYVGREFMFAGIVKQSQHKISQTGNPYGSFVLETMEAAQEFRLFKKDYLTFKPHMQDNLYVVVKGKIIQRKFGENQDVRTEFQIVSIDLLSELKEKFGKYYTLGIEAEFVTQETLDQLDSILVKNSGHAQIRFELRMGEDRIVLPSLEKVKVEITPEIQQQLEAIPGVYQLQLTSR